MRVSTLQLTGNDPIIARDGRPFGAGQGNRMHSLAWPMPSTVAGALRTALVKSDPALDFSGEMPHRLTEVQVSGLFPTRAGQLYLPAPTNCVWDENSKSVFKLRPVSLAGGEGVDLPADNLAPVRLTEEHVVGDFKGRPVPAWWPLSKYVEWLTVQTAKLGSDWFDRDFLEAPTWATRDHVCIDPQTGTAAEGLLFTTIGLNITHLPRFGGCKTEAFGSRFADVKLSTRVAIRDQAFAHLKEFSGWHPIGGERRLAHWERVEAEELWLCPEYVKRALGSAQKVCMILATPAIFQHGFLPAWLGEDSLIGSPFDGGPTLQLMGIANPRWRAVSGWAFQPVDDLGRIDHNGKRGPKPIRRVVPAGSVFFFETVDGDCSALATAGWLQSVSCTSQDQADGYGLAIWGTW